MGLPQSSPVERKLVLIIGATGAQGMAVAKLLLGPAEDGTPPQYRVRALTRDPTSRRAKELAAMGAELFQALRLLQGSFYDMDAARRFMDGCYGAFIGGIR
ncbi:hypothetical protein D9611_015048 [Ephemerocybe angulata]|uniref:NmrA-like domain-containing protein n=1 Tax=Ephemerocybe angulata TaxID=980116 RepID=A0A8H5FEB8_9AGAR|nr:hypothetical protein D9611_015048 [Tulosesus angulatus]